MTMRTEVEMAGVVRDVAAIRAVVPRCAGVDEESAAVGNRVHGERTALSDGCPPRIPVRPLVGPFTVQADRAA